MGCIFRFRLQILVLAAIGLPAVLAQDSGKPAISGVVRDAGGVPVAGADVLLKTLSNETALSTTTDREGKFSLACDKPGSYTLRVTKEGFRDSAQTLTSSSAVVQVVLSPLPTASSAATSAMQFDDHADFTVAGITDWTAAGGHGSDANLRASEALARDTRSLGNREVQNPADAANSENVLRAALSRQPHSFEANHALGSLYLQEHRFAEAVPLLKKAFELNANDAQNSREFVEAYEGAGALDEARALLHQLLAENDGAEWHRLLGDIEEASNQPLAAEREYERAVKKEPTEPNYFAWAGELLVHRAVEPAIEVFTKGARAYPRSERMLAGLGAALYANGQYATAAQRVCEASDLNPADPTPYMFLGKMEQFSSEALPCAKAKLRRFASNQPNNPWASFYYAVSLEKSKDSEGGNDESESESLLKKALAADSQFAPAYLELGIMYSERGDFATAAKFYQKAASADPNLAEAHFRLAQIYKRAGENDKAAHELQAFERVKGSQAAKVEQQRREIQQFVVVLKNSPRPASQ